MTTGCYGSYTMEDAKKMTDIFLPEGPVKTWGENRICENCKQWAGGKGYALIDVSQKNHLRLWWGTHLCWKCDACRYVSWRDCTHALYLKGQFNP